MPQPSWEAVLNQEAVFAQSTVPQLQSMDVTENLLRVVEDFLEARQTGDEARDTEKIW